MLNRHTILALAGASLALSDSLHGQRERRHQHHDDLAKRVAQVVSDPTSYVNTFIGTTNYGDTYPGAATPFGMIALSPQSTSGDQRTTPAPGGYRYDSTGIRGFSLTHVSGVGCEGAAGEIPILPFVGPIATSPSADSKDAIYVGKFSHENEFASPGYYRIGLDSGAGAEVTVTPRTGLAKFTFPEGKGPVSLLFRTSTSESGSADARVHIHEDTKTVTGSIDAGNFCGPQSTNNAHAYYRLHFVAKLDQPFAAIGTWKDTVLRPNTTHANGGTGWDNNGWPQQNKGSGGYVTFPEGTTSVNMRIAVSYVSLAGAKKNLDREQPKGTTFESIAADAKAAWAERLKKIEVGGGTEEQKAIFYTALYHVMLEPTISSDADGSYWGADGAIHYLTNGQIQYGTFSGWDQYRAQVQLLAVLDRKMASDYSQSLFNYANQRDGEWDRWLLGMGKTSIMAGDPSAAAVPSMYAFGARDFDAKGALASLVKSSTIETANDESDAGCPVECVGQRPSLDLYLANGWVPSENCHCWGGAAETLEDSAADYGIAQLAQALGDDAVYGTYLNRSHSWRNVFDHNATGNNAKGWMRDRFSNGTFYPDFEPGTYDGFVEGTAAQYTWMVYSDLVTLIDYMGGDATAVKRLDAFFRFPNGTFDLSANDGTRVDVTNEPCIQTPFLYNYLRAAYKTQETVNAIIAQKWHNSTGGIPGNDDAGTMSAWFVWASLGLYPTVPTRAELILTTPTFSTAVIHLSGGGDLTISAPRDDASDIYVESLTVDGKATTKGWLPADAILNGATLSYTLGSKPSMTWGSGAGDMPPQN